MELNPKLPFYYQIKEDILQKIHSGEYAIGSQLPPEVQMAEKYGVSRPTIRQAIVELVQEGILIRGRGKGTFVSQPLIDDNAQVFTTFSDQVASERYWSQVVESVITPATIKIARTLELPPRTKVRKVTALIMNQSEKLAVRILQIPTELISRQMEEVKDLKTLYESLNSHYGITPTGAVQSFRSIVANTDEAKTLEIEEGTPLTLWEGVVLGGSGTPLMHVKTLFRGDRFKFYIVQGNAEMEKSGILPLGAGIIPPMDGLS